MKRWTKRILLSLAILLVLIVAIVQVIFWSDLPKNLVIDIVQRQLKLRLDADSLSTGWLGNTTLRNVTLTLPLEEDSFVTVPEMRVSHTSPLGVVFGRPIAVYSIAIQQPHLIIRQQPSGEWDIQEVVELVSRVGGGDAAAGRNASKPALKLPELTINNAQVTIIDNQQRQSSLQPLTVHGRPSGPLVYAYDAAIPGHVDLKGRVVPGL
jgi:uncharacterized protein involved in outer membrane biogenesis